MQVRASLAEFDPKISKSYLSEESKGFNENNK